MSEIRKKRFQYEHIYTSHQKELKEKLLAKTQYMLLESRNKDTKTAFHTISQTYLSDLAIIQQSLDTRKSSLEDVQNHIHQIEKVMIKHDITISMLNHLVTYQDVMTNL
jgi:CII-binding regulator of phage lambda lysogenization HflD